MQLTYLVVSVAALAAGSPPVEEAPGLYDE